METDSSPGIEVRNFIGKWLAALAVGLVLSATANAQQVVNVGIGTQNTTTNTVTGGIVIKELGLLEKELAKVPRFKDIQFKIEWQNFTSGPPVTNGMVANTLQIGMMGDYPLLVNGATFQAGNETRSKLIALIAYNAEGAGNGLVVHKDSPYYQLEDLKGKKVSVPFGSAAHGMLLKAMEDRGLKPEDFELSSQSPEVGTSSLQEKRIDGHANFVPFAELLPYRGFARKILDGAETKVPTFHGVVAREDFAKKYPEFIVAYLKALMAANDWVKKDPLAAAAKIEEWTRIEKEVVYMFLGPGGIHTLDPTIKPKWVETIKHNHGVLKRMGRVKDFDADAWVDDSYLKMAYKEMGLDYDRQLASMVNYEVAGTDPVCGGKISNVRNAGEMWIEGGGISAYRSPGCMFSAVRKAEREGKKVSVTYVFDQSMKVKMFADRAFYAIKASGKEPEIVPFLLKKDAEAHASRIGGKMALYSDVVSTVGK